AEITLGRELAARILGNYSLLKDEKINRYVNLVGKGVAQYGGRPELNYHFGVLDTDEVNAFAAPGGYIFITRGALFKMEDEAQLAAVLAHEIGHIVQKHVVKELKIKGEDGSVGSGLATMIGGATSSFRAALDQAIDKAADIVTRRGYKVEDEIDADKIGILMVYMAGYDPLALKRFLNKVSSFETQDKTYKGEHPMHKVRMMKIDKTIRENGMQFAKN
ncbi:MAG: M48 family metalloprotease, partial [Deltaproteobacteria bacterium]|nr:M48 family metalloprotease [Deltaproteobacteria bacterium]